MLFHVINNMNFTTIFNKHTDIISDWLFISCWCFDIEGLKTNPDSGDYTDPVRKSLMCGLAKIASSRNKRIRERSFTIFMGDYGDGFQYFGIGIRYSTYKIIKDIILSEFITIKGFLYETNDRLPYAPFIPVYRYIHGKIIEYTYDDSRVGKKRIDNLYKSGLSIIYRKWISSEVSGLKQKYID